MLAAELIAVVANVYGLDPAQIRTANPRTGRLCHAEQFSHPRQVCCFLLVEYQHRSLKETGRLVGGLHHTSVLYACRKIRRLMRCDPEVLELVQGFVERLQLENDRAAAASGFRLPPASRLLAPRDWRLNIGGHLVRRTPVIESGS